MTIKAIVDNIEDIPEAHRELYSERDGKFELTGVEGMKTQADIERLQSALTKERNDHKTVKDKLHTFGDLDADAVHAQLDRVKELEAAAGGNIDEAKMEELLEGRMRVKLGPLERELKTLRTTNETLTGTVGEYETKETRRTIHDAVRKACRTTKVEDSAIDDALLLGERVFEVAEDGKTVITRDGVGVTPGLSAEVWLSEMQSKRPHWWGPSQGGGARPGQKFSAADNPWSADNWNVTKQNQMTLENRTRAEQMAKSAGTTIGGLKPRKAAAG